MKIDKLAIVKKGKFHVNQIALKDDYLLHTGRLNCNKFSDAYRGAVNSE